MKKYIRSSKITCSEFPNRAYQNIRSKISYMLNDSDVDYGVPVYVYLGQYKGDIYGAIFTWADTNRLYGKVACTPNIGGLPNHYDDWEFPVDANGNVVDTEVEIKPNNADECVDTLVAYWQPFYDKIISEYVESSTSIKCSKVIDFAEHKVTKDDVSDADWDQLQHTVNFDYYDSLQQMAQDLVNVIEDDQVWSEVEWNIFHAWYDEKGFTDDDWDYVESCGYDRDQF